MAAKEIGTETWQNLELELPVIDLEQFEKMIEQIRAEIRNMLSKGETLEQELVEIDFEKLQELELAGIDFEKMMEQIQAEIQNVFDDHIPPEDQERLPKPLLPKPYRPRAPPRQIKVAVSH